MSALTFAARHINASPAAPIDELSLIDALGADGTSRKWQHYLDAFFAEPIETLGDIVRSGTSTRAM